MSHFWAECCEYRKAAWSPQVAVFEHLRIAQHRALGWEGMSPSTFGGPGEHSTMTPEAYLYQVLAPAVIAAVRTMMAVMVVLAGVALLGAVLAIVWNSRESIAKPAGDTVERYYSHAGGGLTTVH
jgi:hypothetical protein